MVRRLRGTGYFKDVGDEKDEIFSQGLAGE